MAWKSKIEMNNEESKVDEMGFQQTWSTYFESGRIGYFGFASARKGAFLS